MNIKPVVLATMLLICVSAVVMTVSEESEAVEVSSVSDLESSMASEGTAVVNLTSNIEMDSVIRVSGDKTLTSSNGSWLIRSTSYAEGNLLYVEDGASLTLSGSVIIDGNSDWISENESDSLIENHGVLTIEGSAELRNNHYGVPSTMWGTAPPGGSAVTNYGTMTISGGSLSENSGGNAVVYVDGGTLSMTAGSICENESRGMALEDGASFDMSGGRIDGNNGGISASGGVFSWSTVRISGGSISDNVSRGSIGSGVYLEFQANLVMSGGTIDGNSLSSGIDTRGAGIYIGNDCQATLSGGTISNNHASSGGGVYAIGDLTIDGATIKDNTYDGVYVNQTTAVMTDGSLEGNAVRLYGGTFSITGGEVTGIPNAVQIANQVWGGTFQMGGTAKFDSESTVSIHVWIVKGDTDIMSNHAITIRPSSYVEGTQVATGSPAALLGLNHSKIDVVPYEGERWVVDEDGRLVNTHEATSVSDDDEGGQTGGDDPSYVWMVVAIIAILAVAAIFLKMRSNR